MRFRFTYEAPTGQAEVAGILDDRTPGMKDKTSPGRQLRMAVWNQLDRDSPRTTAYRNSAAAFVWKRLGVGGVVIFKYPHGPAPPAEPPSRCG